MGVVYSTRCNLSNDEAIVFINGKPTVTAERLCVLVGAVLLYYDRIQKPAGSGMLPVVSDSNLGQQLECHRLEREYVHLRGAECHTVT